MPSPESFVIRPIKFTVLPKGAPVFSERATEVSIDDEGGGEYIVVSQENDDGKRTLKFDIDEWKHVVRAANMALREIRKHAKKSD